MCGMKVQEIEEYFKREYIKEIYLLQDPKLYHKAEAKFKKA